MGDKRIFAIIALAILGILVLAFFSSAGGGGTGGIGSKNGEVIACEVQVKNPVVGSASISDVSCLREKCGLFDTLSIFGAEGSIKMKVNGVVVNTASYDFNLGSATTKVFNLKSKCISKGNTASIDLIRDDGKLLDSKGGL